MPTNNSAKSIWSLDSSFQESYRWVFLFYMLYLVRCFSQRQYCLRNDRTIFLFSGLDSPPLEVGLVLDFYYNVEKMCTKRPSCLAKIVA